MIDREFDDFRIIRKIGEGGMGKVYLTFQKSLEREVALKIIDVSSSFDDNTAVERFVNEAKTAASVQHPNIVSVYAIGQVDGNLYLSMEYVDGQSLDDILVEQNICEEKFVWRVALQICHGLQAALEKGIIHRDIKPENIILDKRKLVKITDFGLSRRLDDKSRLTKEGIVVGTPEFMSPEQAVGQIVDFRSDIYSLGASLYNLLTGKLIFRGAPIEILVKHRNDKVVPPQMYVPDLSIASSMILGKMLSKEPSDRYQNYESLIQDIELLLAESLPRIAKAPQCFSVYTHIPDFPQKGLIGKIKSWIHETQKKSGAKTQELLENSNKETVVTANAKETESQYSLKEILAEVYIQEEVQRDQDIAETKRRENPILSQPRLTKTSQTLDVILDEISEELDSLIFIAVIGENGMPISKKTRTTRATINIDSFAAKYTMVMRLLQKSFSSIGHLGTLEENLLQSDQAWVLTRFLDKNHFLCIALQLDGVIGNARMVAKKYSVTLKQAIQ